MRKKGNILLGSRELAYEPRPQYRKPIQQAHFEIFS
jgi:hypothetical protein